MLGDGALKKTFVEPNVANESHTYHPSKIVHRKDLNIDGPLVVLSLPRDSPSSGAH